jgi:hypothetical protein
MKKFSIKLYKKDSYINGNDILYHIPIIDAFGIVSYTYYSGIISNGEEGNIIIKDKKLVLVNYAEYYKHIAEFSILTISYCAIRDYSLLFPSILKENKKLAQRLGKYYYEAEKAFEGESWLTYSLMCAAIYEGLLYFKITERVDFIQKINGAFNRSMINEKERNLMHIARQKRNLVHPNNYNQEYVLRSEAVDMRTAMDDIIHRLG